jgi:hypothetical protein
VCSGSTSSDVVTVAPGCVRAVLDACFRSFGAGTVDVLSVNGHVQTINTATGRPDHPCLVTVTTDRVCLRIHALERNELAAKIKELLGFDVVISNQPPAYRDGGIRPRRLKQSTGEWSRKAEAFRRTLVGCAAAGDAERH